MYAFMCPNGHRSRSASPKEGLSDCPECGGPTRLLGEEVEARELDGLLVAMIAAVADPPKPTVYMAAGPTCRAYVASFLIHNYTNGEAIAQ